MPCSSPSVSLPGYACPAFRPTTPEQDKVTQYQRTHRAWKPDQPLHGLLRGATYLPRPFRPSIRPGLSTAEAAELALPIGGIFVALTISESL